MADHRREGFALVVVILVLLAITAVGHTLLILTMSELSVAEARWELLTRRLAAQAGLALVSMDGPTVTPPPIDRWVSFGAGRIPPRARFERTAVRLSLEIFLVRSEGSVETSPGVYRRVGMFWRMDPVARVASARAVVETGSELAVGASGGISMARIADDPAHWLGSDCDPHRADLDTLFPGGLLLWAKLAEDARLEAAEDATGRAMDLRLPSLGLLGHDDVPPPAVPLAMLDLKPLAVPGAEAF